MLDLTSHWKVILLIYWSNQGQKDACKFNFQVLCEFLDNAGPFYLLGKGAHFHLLVSVC